MVDDRSTAGSKRVLHVVNGLGDTGVASVLTRLVGADHDHRHFVVSLMDEGKYGAELADHAELFCLNMRPGRPSTGAFVRLMRIMRDIRPDVVQTWLHHSDLVGGLAARVSGVPHIVWGVRMGPLLRGGTKATTRAVAKTCAIVSHWVPDRIVTPSAKAAEVSVAMGYPAKKFQIIPNGYDLTRFKPSDFLRAEVRQALGLDRGEILIGNVARYDIQKDHGTLLRAIALVRSADRPVVLLLVGRGMGADNAELTALINETGVADLVRCVGQRDDIPAIMNALDIMVLSSSFGEAFPNVVAEAMACGTPCVATDVGDSAEIVGGNGWIVPPRHPHRLAEAIMTALVAMDDAEEWRLRREACRDHIFERYDLNRMVTGFKHAWTQ